MAAELGEDAAYDRGAAPSASPRCRLRSHFTAGSDAGHRASRSIGVPSPCPGAERVGGGQHANSARRRWRRWSRDRGRGGGEPMPPGGRGRRRAGGRLIQPVLERCGADSTCWSTTPAIPAHGCSCAIEDAGLEAVTISIHRVFLCTRAASRSMSRPARRSVNIHRRWSADVTPGDELQRPQGWCGRFHPQHGRRIRQRRASPFNCRGRASLHRDGPGLNVGPFSRRFLGPARPAEDVAGAVRFLGADLRPTHWPGFAGGAAC